jgi:hypothetical protein
MQGFNLLITFAFLKLKVESMQGLIQLDKELMNLLRI